MALMGFRSRHPPFKELTNKQALKQLRFIKQREILNKKKKNPVPFNLYFSINMGETECILQKHGQNGHQTDIACRLEFCQRISLWKKKVEIRRK